MGVLPTAGELNKRVTLQASAQVLNELRERVQTWQPLPSGTVWAKFQDLRGRDFFAQGQMQTAVEARCVIRYRADVTAHTRVLHDGVAYSIVGKPIVLGRKQFLELMCTSGPRERDTGEN